MEQRRIRSLEHAKILIIDDIEANLSLLRRMLNLNGFQNIRTLTDSRQSLKVFADYQPDIVLLDLKMPYMDGFDVIRELRSHMMVDNLPVIMISAQDEIENKLKAFSIGVQDFISKPFHHADVVSRIKKFLKRTCRIVSLNDNNNDWNDDWDITNETSQ